MSKESDIVPTISKDSNDQEMSINKIKLIDNQYCKYNNPNCDKWHSSKLLEMKNKIEDREYLEKSKVVKEVKEEVKCYKCKHAVSKHEEHGRPVVNEWDEPTQLFKCNECGCVQDKVLED